MITSRRLAREWALKILYQMDVGGFPLSEALETALERLRLEFVLRGSRSASGSHAEQIVLQALTQELRDVLPDLRLPLERALTEAVALAFQEVPYWQEIRLERSFRHQAPGVPLIPPRLLSPLPDRAFFPVEPAGGKGKPGAGGLAVALSALTPTETARYRVFVESLREQLPKLIETELRKTGLANARDLAANRPLGVEPQALQNTLTKRREAFNAAAQERWRKVGAMVQKQLGDWLHTAAFTRRLVMGTRAQVAEIDRQLSELAAGWSLDRQVIVDRNILRLAAYEILYLPSIPTAVAINEAVELAKKYSTAESSRFVNGVLGALAAQAAEQRGVAEEDAGEEEADTPVDVPDIDDLEDHATE